MRVLSTIVVLIVGLTVLGAGYAMWFVALPVDITVATGHIGLEFTDFNCSDVPGDPDLGQTKDVASAECVLVDTDGDGGHDTLQITVFNAYPGFQMMVENVVIQGQGTVPVHITDTSFTFDGDDGGLVMDLEGFWTDSNLVCLQIHAGDVITGNFWLHMSVEQVALESHAYTFLVAIDYAQWNETHCPPGAEDLGGTPGFWGNWDSHNTYTEEQILAWLDSINASSAWPLPTTIAAMETLFKTNKPMLDNFRRHYLATSLNIKAGRLSTATTHDYSAQDPADYLGLGGSASLSDIVAAIEAKFAGTPDEDHLEILKDICDALNNLEI